MFRKILVAIPNGIIYLFGWLFGMFFKAGLKIRLFDFPYISQFLSFFPFSIGWKFRRAVYHQLLPAIASDTVLHVGVRIEDQRSSFGRDIWVSTGSYLDYVIMEDHVLIGPNAILLSGGKHHRTDRIDIPIKLQKNHPKQPLHIGRGAWIGAGAIVMADVGHDAIIGAGSVVTKKVEPYSVVAGNPAKVIRSRIGESPIE